MPDFSTLPGLLETIPPEWRDAKFAIEDNDIKAVRFEIDADGNKTVILVLE